MNQSVQVNNILSQIRMLDYQSRIYLMEQMIRLLKLNTPESNESSHLLELNGLGANIWADTNIDEYVKSGREWD